MEKLEITHLNIILRYRYVHCHVSTQPLGNLPERRGQRFLTGLKKKKNLSGTREFTYPMPLLEKQCFSLLKSTGPLKICKYKCTRYHYFSLTSYKVGNCASGQVPGQQLTDYFIQLMTKYVTHILFHIEPDLLRNGEPSCLVS